MRSKTWKVLKWDRPDGIPDGDPIPIVCVCGNDAEVPTAGKPGCMILAILGHGGIIFDRPSHKPPDHWMPEEIECRQCHRILSAAREGVTGVRQAV